MRGRKVFLLEEIDLSNGREDKKIYLNEKERAIAAEVATTQQWHLCESERELLNVFILVKISY